MIVVHSFKHSIESLQTTFEARASEWMMTGSTLSLSVVFLLHTGLLDKPNFEGLAAIMDSQIAWGVLFASVGIVGLTVLVINGAYWRTPHFRALTAFLRCGVWFFLTLGFIANGSLMAAILPWVFLLDAYNVKRASREAGKSEFLQRYTKKNQDLVDARLASRPHT